MPPTNEVTPFHADLRPLRRPFRMLLPALNSKLPRLPSALLICPGRFLKKFKMLLTPLETAVLAWFIAF